MISSTWMKLPDVEGEYIGRATRFLINNSPEYEQTVEFYLVEDPTSPASFTLYVSTGHKAGCIRVKFPEEASGDGVRAISKSWLIQNWRKWVIDTDPQEVLCKIGYEPGS
jgi:hypothetical protein